MYIVYFSSKMGKKKIKKGRKNKILESSQEEREGKSVVEGFYRYEYGIHVLCFEGTCVVECD